MICYKFYGDEQKKGYQLLGVLPERRQKSERITKESALNWGKQCFGNNYDMFFVDEEITGVPMRDVGKKRITS
jgi:hypothetical protein